MMRSIYFFFLQITQMLPFPPKIKNSTQCIALQFSKVLFVFSAFFEQSNEWSKEVKKLKLFTQYTGVSRNIATFIEQSIYVSRLCNKFSAHMHFVWNLKSDASLSKFLKFWVIPKLFLFLDKFEMCFIWSERWEHSNIIDFLLIYFIYKTR